MSNETKQPAVVGQVERGVRAHDPERAAFEAAMAKKGYHQPPALYRDGSYRDNCYSAGWDAWQAARPPRHEIGRLVNLAAECAQRKPLRALEPLTEVSHIGHRQFSRAYAGADEAVRLLAIELRRVADAL